MRPTPRLSLLPSYRRAGAGAAVAARARRIGAIFAATGLAAALLAGCTSGNDSSGATVMAEVTSAAAATAGAAVQGEAPAAQDESGSAAQDGESKAGAGSGAAGRSVPDVALADRQVIRTASMSFTERVAPVVDPATGEPDADAEAAARAAAIQAAAARIGGITAAAGGFRGAVEGTADTLVVTLRIPEARYETVMTELGALGTPEKLVESTTDVTTQVVDLESRIATMQAGVDRVRALLAQAEDVGEVIAIESELTAREADLESLLSQQAALTDQVALSTITVTVNAVTDVEPVAAVVPAAGPSGFAAGLAAGWSAAKKFVVWVGAVVGALLPWLPLIAVVVVLVFWIRRRLQPPVVPPAARPTPGPAPEQQ